MRFNALAYFFEHEGSIRLSLTDRCDRQCWFCHHEGQTLRPHGSEDPTADPERHRIRVLVQLLADLGARRFYLTGGEPALRDDLPGVVTDVHAVAPAAAITLASSTPRVCDHLVAIGPGIIKKLKLSVHALSGGRTNRGVRTWGCEDLSRTVRICRGFTTVEFNVLATRSGRDSVRGILSQAARLGVDVQVLELIWNPAIAEQYEREALGVRCISDSLLLNGGLIESVSTATVAGHITVIRWKGIRVKFFEPRAGILHGRICSTCSLRRKCVEGLFAIRYDTDLSASPCLLRPDSCMPFGNRPDSSRTYANRLKHWFRGILGDIPPRVRPRDSVVCASVSGEEEMKDEFL